MALVHVVRGGPSMLSLNLCRPVLLDHPLPLILLLPLPLALRLPTLFHWTAVGDTGQLYGLASRSINLRMVQPIPILLGP